MIPKKEEEVSERESVFVQKDSQSPRPVKWSLVDAVVVLLVDDGLLLLSVELVALEALRGVLEHAGAELLELEVDGQWLRPEEVVVEGLVAVDAPLRVQRQQLVEQIERVRVLDVDAQALLDATLQVWLQLDSVEQIQFLHISPHVGRDRATQALDQL